MNELQQLEREIGSTMLVDRAALRRQLSRIRQRHRERKPADRLLAALRHRLLNSARRRAQRLAAVPQRSYPAELPVSARREELAAAIGRYQVLVVCGETGSGKSTQLPKICLDVGRGVDGMIGHTQPRRIAARTVAARVASELGCELGGLVGYQIRFDDHTRDSTLIKLMTDGILLAETQNDRFLERYDTIILDEAHERSLNIDFLLGLLTRLVVRRRELKVIVTSATIDAERFSRHFAEALGSEVPVIEVSGRAYPVDVHYLDADQPAKAGQGSGGERTDTERVSDYKEQLQQALVEACNCGPGDILVFLPTEREIRDVSQWIRGRRTAGQLASELEVLPLYARLSTAEQNRVFQSHAGRRVVLATNVAESSLTVPGIRFVIDTGTARISRFSARSKVQRLPVEAVSQASANQRMGRCGRIGPGVCYRLYREDDFLSRDRYTTPEIRRTNLASVILQSTALHLGDIAQFPFLDPPRPEAIRDGYSTLFELNAMSENRQLTEIGQQLSRFPVDPRIARIILAANEENCLAEILIIAAALEVQDPRLRPVDKQQAADEAHQQFADEKSDFMGLLRLWDFYHGLRDRLSRNQLAKACRQNFLSHNRIREWLEVHRQLREIVRQQGMPVRHRRDDYRDIHTALLTGLLFGLAHRGDGSDYTAAGGKGFSIWPGSGTRGSKPKWLVSAEQLETNRRYLRTTAQIDPAWVEPIAEHLTKRSYSDPQWQSKTATVTASERVSLFSLPLVVGRRVRYGPIDPSLCRQIFIQNGLVEGQFDQSPGEFYRHNLELLEAIRQDAARTRKRELVVDEWTLYGFYDQRVPSHVFDVASLRQWLQSAGNDALLRMRREDIVDESDEDESRSNFPHQISIGTMKLPLKYQFDPAAEQDGVTLTVPAAGLSQLESSRLGWLVPGLLEEKLVALIRSLPKRIRRNLVPAPDTARQVAADLPFGEGEFLVEVARRFSRIAEEPISTDDFRVDKIPRHLQMNVQVVDGKGQPLAVARNLTELRDALGQDTPQESATIEDRHWNKSGMQDWDFGELPREVRIRRGGIAVPAYPALRDDGSCVSLTLLDSPEAARRSTVGGLRRLLAIRYQKQLRSQVAWLPQLDNIRLSAHPAYPAEQLQHDTGLLIAERGFLADESNWPRDAQQFAQLDQRSAAAIGGGTDDVSRLLPKLFENIHRVRLALEESERPAIRPAIDDMRHQFQQLTSNRFLLTTPWQWLLEMPRFLEGILFRREKLNAGGHARDAGLMREIQGRVQQYEALEQRHGELGIVDAELVTCRWMLEEYRVSLFAQQLGTSITISSQRLDRQWKKVRKPDQSYT